MHLKLLLQGFVNRQGHGEARRVFIHLAVTKTRRRSQPGGSLACCGAGAWAGAPARQRRTAERPDQLRPSALMRITLSLGPTRTAGTRNDSSQVARSEVSCCCRMLAAPHRTPGTVSVAQRPRGGFSVAPVTEGESLMLLASGNPR